jgi:hypothetical protein
LGTDSDTAFVCWQTRIIFLIFRVTNEYL